MNAVLAAMKPPLLEMLGSKKVLAGLSGIAVLIGASILSVFHVGGIEPDPDKIKFYIGLIMAYIVGQGITDHGKPAAIINAAAAALKPAASPVTNNVTVGEINK